MASADCLVHRSTEPNPSSPQVRHLSFHLILLHLQRVVCWSGALQRCACLPTAPCLLCSFCSSVQVFVVPLPSDVRSPLPPLRLVEDPDSFGANRLHQLADKGFAPSGYSEYISSKIYPCHSGHTHCVSGIFGRRPCRRLH